MAGHHRLRQMLRASGRRRRMRVDAAEERAHRRDRDCFMRAPEGGDMRCAANGMRALRECVFIDHGGDISNDICRPIMPSVTRAAAMQQTRYAHGDIRRVSEQDPRTV